MEKKFFAKNVFYNNGIVNLTNFLEQNSIDGLNYFFENNSLTLNFENSEIYYEILAKFLENSKIVFQTNNERIYFDVNRNDFVLDKKFDVVGRASGNDVLHGVYSYISVAELKESVSEIYQKYKNFCENNNQKIDEDLFFDKETKEFKSENKIRFTKNITIAEALENFSRYFVSSEILTMDSKIHQFEDGGNSFKDMFPKSDTIDKWDALIYWFGVRIQRFFNNNYFIYPNSQNLNALKLFKQELKILENKAEVKVKDSQEVKTLPTNIDLFKQLSIDGLKNEHFYISNSGEEFELKLFMYIFSYINHIEEHYEKANERRKKQKEELYNSLNEITFIVYTQDGDMKSSLDEYTKAYKLVEFFKKLKISEKNDSNMFHYLSNLITSISLAKSSGEKINLNIKSFCANLLNFKNLRKNYYEASFKILKEGTNRLSKELFEFENLYLNFIKKEQIVNLHEKSKKLGEEIGRFCANLDDKDLLFKLRNVKNHNQLVSYFASLKFAVLKNAKEAYFSKAFIDTLDEILTILNEKKDNWEIIKDYIAIYAIDKFKEVSFVKNKKGE